MNEPCKDCKVHSAIEVMIDAICKKIETQEKIQNIKFEAMYESIKIAKEEMERRLEGMNEFRVQLSNQASTFSNKKELELILEKMESRFDFMSKSNRERIDQLEKEYSERKGGRLWETVIVTSMVSGAIIFIAHFLLKF